MRRVSPVSNKILSKKWEENDAKIHSEKLKNMQARVNRDRPLEFGHLKTKAKREQILEDRYTEIERENRILLEKMNSIMNKKQLKNQPKSKKSLNKKARKIEMERINIENQALLKRLQQRTPCYTIQQWEEDRKKTEKHLKNICEFPYVGSRGKSTPASFKKPRKLTPISQTGVYKKGVAVGSKHFIVEIKKNKRNLVIALNDAESPDSYCLKIPINEALDLMGGSFQFDKIVKMLDMENGEIVLVDPGERKGHESAPVKNEGKIKTEFGEKPRTGKATQSYEYGSGKKGQKEKSYAGYDKFDAGAKRKSNEEGFEKNAESLSRGSEEYELIRPEEEESNDFIGDDNDVSSKSGKEEEDQNFEKEESYQNEEYEVQESENSYGKGDFDHAEVISNQDSEKITPDENLRDSRSISSDEVNPE